jgi:autotransporter-associated beta strand protein
MRLLSNTLGDRNMNKKTILISNCTASVRPAAWLALSILSLVYSSPVFADVWLDQNYSSYTVGDQVGTNNTPSLISSVPSNNVIVDVSGNKKLQYYKLASAAGGGTLYKLSDNLSTDRPKGYFSFKATIGANVTGSSYLSYVLGANDTNGMAAAASTYLQIRLYNATTTTNQLRIYSGSGNTNNPTQVWPTSGYLTIPTNQNSFQVWYNKTASAMPYTNSAGVSNQVSPNSFVVYINGTLYGSNASSTGLLPSTVQSVAGTVTNSVATIGKLGWQGGGSAQPYDVTFDDIYAADAAPSGASINSETTATAQAGYPFSYTITSSALTAPVTYSTTSTLPTGLTLESSTGVISGTISTGATQGLNSINLTATGTGGATATGTLGLTITAPPNAAPAITSAATASGFLTRVFTYQIATSTTTPSSTPTSYAIVTGTLPAGLNLTATGAITGTPTELTPDGGTQITYTATNPFGTSDAQTLTITINPAPVFTWNNTGTAWTNATSWTNGVAPANSASTDIAAFGNLGSSATSVDVGAGRSIGGIVFNSGAFAYTWTGTDITVGGTSGITNNSTAIQTFDNKILNTGSDPTWSSVFGGSLVFNGAIDLSTTGVSRKLTIAGAGNVTVNGVIANGGTSSAGQVYKSGTGTLRLNGANTYTGTTEVVDGTMILSAPNSSISYKLGGYDTNIFPVLKVSETNALSLSATLAGSSSSTKTGTLEFTTNGNYTLNQYAGNNMNFSNSSGSATTLTFTNATNVLSTGGGRTFANQSANLRITFNGEVDIAGNTNNTCTISAVGPVVISNRVFNSNTNFIRNLEKLGTGNLTMYGVNSYNGSTIVSRGTLSIPTAGSLINCSNTVVGNTNEVASANSASLNLAGVAGVVQVTTNGFVRGGGSITSLQVQDAGTVEVAVGTTWITGGTIDFAAGSKVSVTGTPTAGNTYTLMTASSVITGSIPTLVGVTDWQLDVEGTELKLKQVQLADGFSQLFPDTAFDAVVNGSKVGLQYAFGSPTGMPQNNGLTALPVVSGNTLTYTFDVKEDSALTVTYQTSSDLVTWSAAQAVSPGTGAAASGFIKKQAQATGSGKLFIRINVTR